MGSKTYSVPNIPPSAAIVPDNASYHNVETDKPPCKSSTMKQMKAWLESKGIVYECTDLKFDLSQDPGTPAHTPVPHRWSSGWERTQCVTPHSSSMRTQPYWARMGFSKGLRALPQSITLDVSSVCSICMCILLILKLTIWLSGCSWWGRKSRWKESLPLLPTCSCISQFGIL